MGSHEEISRAIQDEFKIYTDSDIFAPWMRVNNNNNNNNK